MKRAIIFYNGDLSDVSAAKDYIKDTDFILCADGGTKYAVELGCKPHAIIGDFDSLSKDLQTTFSKEEIDFIKFNTEKDETDSELALQYVIGKGYKTILVFGLFGSRLDHLLTNIFALSYLNKKGIDVTFVEGKQEIRLIKNEIKLTGKPGDLVSLIPFRGDVKGVSTQNMQYPLINEDLLFGYSRGISNVMKKTTAKVTVTEGLLLVIHTKQ